MLFTYSSDFAVHNWLHNIIFDQLQRSMRQIDNNEATVEWPDWLPAEYRDKLEGKRSLGDHVSEFLAAYRNLSEPERVIVLEALISHNCLPKNLQGLVACRPKGALPHAIQEPSSRLFDYAFRLLTTLGCRDKQYEVIYSAASWKVCPFCGIQPLDAVGAPREDLDHYLVRSKYPFCGANLRNLAPMCSRCNTKYKKTQDVIFDDTLMTSRRASDPYSGPTFRICLNSTPPYTGTTTTPEWQIQIKDECQEADTWNRVFKITERYPRDVLTPHFSSWTRDFGSWGARVLRKIPTLDELKETIRNYVDDEMLKGFSDSAFLKVSVFCMFLNQLENNNTDLHFWLGSVINTYL